MNLPGYLQPQGDGWRIDDAVTLWGLIHFEIAVGTPDTPAVKRLRHRARREVVAVATETPESPDPPRGSSLRPRYSNWFSGGDYPSSRMEPTRQGVKCAPSRTWVTVAALAGLCRQHGHPCPWEQEADPAGLPPSPTSNTAKPGPKQSPAMTSAIQEALALVESGRPLKSAAMNAANKYGVNSGTVLRTMQRKRNSP